MTLDIVSLEISVEEDTSLRSAQFSSAKLVIAKPEIQSFVRMRKIVNFSSMESVHIDMKLLTSMMTNLKLLKVKLKS